MFDFLVEAMQLPARCGLHQVRNFCEKLLQFIVQRVLRILSWDSCRSHTRPRLQTFVQPRANILLRSERYWDSELLACFSFLRREPTAIKQQSTRVVWIVPADVLTRYNMSKNGPWGLVGVLSMDGVGWGGECWWGAHTQGARRKEEGACLPCGERETRVRVRVRVCACVRACVRVHDA